MARRKIALIGAGQIGGNLALLAAQKELGRLERKLDQLHAKEEKLHAALLEAATDPATLMELNAELKGVQGEIEDVESRWLETSELLE